MAGARTIRANPSIDSIRLHSALCRLLRTSAVIACRRRSRQPPRATVPTGRLGGPGPAAPDCAAVLTAQGLAPNSPSHGRHAPGGACLCSVLEQTALDASPYGDAQPLRGCAPRRLPRPAGPAARAGCGPQSWFSTNTNPLPQPVPGWLPGGPWASLSTAGSWGCESPQGEAPSAVCSSTECKRPAQPDAGRTRASWARSPGSRGAEGTPGAARGDAVGSTGSHPGTGDAPISAH